MEVTYPISKSKFATGAALVALLGGVVIALRVATGSPPGPTSIPECNSNTARDMFQEAIKNAPQAALGLKLLKLGNIVKTGNDAMDKDNEVRARFCAADAFTNVGRNDVYFTLKWADATKKEIYLEAPYLPF